MSRTAHDPLIARLRRALAGPLPGRVAHALAIPEGYDRGEIPDGSPVVPSAVLLALHPGAGGSRINFPLIRRPDAIPHHAGQIGLPGGAMEPEEDAIGCALREAEEEVGLDAASVEILGGLTPVTIPVSGYRVEPVVGWIPARPTYRPQEGEVIEILLGDPDRLAAAGLDAWIERERGGRLVRFPAYAVGEAKVWGATALILSEFLSVWRSVRGLTP